MRLVRPAFVLAAYLGAGCTIAVGQQWDGEGRGRGPSVQQRRLDVQTVRLELRTHDRYERETLRCEGRKIGHVSALFTDADGRNGTVRVVVQNDSHCRLALHAFARAERSGYDGDRETELLAVGPHGREEFSIRVELPQHYHRRHHGYGPGWGGHDHRRERDVSVTVTIRGELKCRPRDARPH